MAKSLEYINYQITTLEDSLQHYTMVDKDKVKEAYIKHDLECLYKIKEELEVLEICKNDPVIIYTLKTLAKGESINWHRLSEEQQEKLKKELGIKDE
jgi:hypothetical protein